MAKLTTTCITTEDEAEFPPLAPPPSTSRHQSISLDTPEQLQRRATPPFPPGLQKNVVDADRPASRAGLKRMASAQIVPALPLRPVTPVRAATPGAGSSLRKAKEGMGDEVETPTRAPKGAGAETKDIAASVSALERSDEQAKSPHVESTAGQQENAAEDQGEKVVASPKPAQRSAPHAIQPSSKGQATVKTSDAQAVPETPTKPESAPTEGKKRTPPGKLDITAAVSKEPVASSSATSADSGTPSVAQRSVAQTPAETSSPSGSITSPAVKAAPKTLRVVPTGKTEPAPAAASTSRERTASTAKQPSRQPSVASIQIPGTPSSEQVSISDNISIPSTSQSRASSPPPAAGNGKVGSAPMRAKTKSQLKKERQERAKAIEEEKKVEDTKKPVIVPEEEPAQEAIVSRKKKTKKEKEPKVKAKAPTPLPTEDSTPTASRAPSPPKAVEEIAAKVEPDVEKTKSPEPSTPTKAPTPLQPSKPPPQEPSPPPTPTLTAAQILAELKATAPELQKCIDSLFRSATSTHYKPNQNITPADLENPAVWDAAFKVNLNKSDVDALLKGKVPAVRYNNSNKGDESGRVWDRGMVTPSGAHLRALTEELETRFLELEKAIRELPTELTFRPSKPQNDMKFPAIDLQALKRQFESPSGRGVSLMERAVQEGSDMTKGSFLVDEARGYVNEFVMPPATPPPTPGSVRGQQQQQQQQQQQVAMGPAQGSSGSGDTVIVPSMEIAERQLNEARRMADERDAALKKAMKKNKKLLGLGG